VIRPAYRERGTDATEHNVEALLRFERVRTRGLHAWIDGDLSVIRDPVAPPLAVRLREGVIDAEEWGVRLRLGDGRDAAWRWRTTITSDAIVIRSRRPGDRVRTSAGTKKVQDVLVDAKIPRALRDLVPVLTADDSAVAVVGLTSDPSPSGLVLDAEPLNTTWSRKVVWTSR
jgi:tRNA(Ile)-lysidine synthetase-like protein